MGQGEEVQWDATHNHLRTALDHVHDLDDRTASDDVFFDDDPDVVIDHLRGALYDFDLPATVIDYEQFPAARKFHDKYVHFDINVNDDNDDPA